MESSLDPSQKTVLIVEDEPIIRMLATLLVEDAGLPWLESDGAGEALELLETHSEIGTVFTDVQMAGSMDGLQLSRLAFLRWPPLKFVIVSGNHVPGAADMPRGACFFAKPYNIGEITRALHAFA